MQAAPDVWGSETLPVPVGLLSEILEDGTCPLHIRIQLRRLLNPPDPKLVLQAAKGAANSMMARLEPCLLHVASQLPLAEVLAVRACSTDGLVWAMRHACGHIGEVGKAHDRIRTRLWIQRLAEVNSGSADETVYETPVRRLADEALRRRMEAEMADARHDMEQQIRAFQVEVDRRMEQQAVRVHAIVEERVQQQIDTILAVEMEKVRAMVEERVQGRVRAVVQREVHATVCEMQVRLAMLARENDRLRTSFLEHLDHSDLCFRSLVWALSPNATGVFARTLRLMWCCRRRFTRLSAWLLGVPPDQTRESLRNRLETLHRTTAARPSGPGTPSSASSAAGSALAALRAAGVSPAAAAVVMAAAAGASRRQLAAENGAREGGDSEGLDDGTERQQALRAIEEGLETVQAVAEDLAARGSSSPSTSGADAWLRSLPGWGAGARAAAAAARAASLRDAGSEEADDAEWSGEASAGEGEGGAEAAPSAPPPATAAAPRRAAAAIAAAAAALVLAARGEAPPRSPTAAPSDSAPPSSATDAATLAAAEGEPSAEGPHGAPDAGAAAPVEAARGERNRGEEDEEEEEDDDGPPRLVELEEEEEEESANEEEETEGELFDEGNFTEVTSSEPDECRARHVEEEQEEPRVAQLTEDGVDEHSARGGQPTQESACDVAELRNETGEDEVVGEAGEGQAGGGVAAASP